MRQKLLLLLLGFSAGLFGYASDGGLTLAEERFQGSFSQDGFYFVPAGGGPDWRWQLLSVSAGKQQIAGGGACMEPQRSSRGIVFEHTFFQELYLQKGTAIEQQFILPANPGCSSGDDLIIEGAVVTDGDFEQTHKGWVWTNPEGVVSLGDVFVFDANGREIPAHMEVSANHSRIVVNGAALAQAAYPVTVDPEVGVNDFRVTIHGVDGDGSLDCNSPDIAYNATDNQYLVVYAADTIAGKDEIHAWIIDANGSRVGNEIKISSSGNPLNTTLDAVDAAVAWNATNNEYMVVWEADTDVPPQVGNEQEVYGQRLSNTGVKLGSQFKISQQGPDGNGSYDAVDPDISWNSINNSYMVVWAGDTIVSEDEIWGRRLDSAGNPVSAILRLTNQGVNGATNTDAFAPTIAFNDSDNEFMLAWSGDTIAGKDEIYAQILDGNNANRIGNPIKISSSGIPGNISYDAFSPDIVYNPDENHFLIVWSGDDTTGGLVEGENEIFGQLMDASGIKLGGNFVVSNCGPLGSNGFDAFDPKVAYSPSCQEYLVTFECDSTLAGEDEIYVQLISDGGVPIGVDTMISRMGGPGASSLDATNPALVFNETVNEYMIVWQGEDTVGALIDNEFEIFGQRWACDAPCTAPSITSITGVDTFCVGSNGLITATAFGNVDSLQWQVSTNSGASWTDLSNGMNYMGVNSDSLQLMSVPGSFLGNQYRALVFGCGSLSDSSMAFPIVLDAVAPMITCPSDTTIQPTTFDCDPVVNFNPAVASDNCGAPAVSYSPAQGSNFSVGTTNVTANADDGVNQTNCSFNVTVLTPQLTGVITQNGDTLCSSVSGASYQWSLNGVPVSGATSQCIVPVNSGVYGVAITDANGCTAESDTLSLIVGQAAPVQAQIRLWPNPSTGLIHVSGVKGQLEVYNSSGQLVKQDEIRRELEIDLRDQAQGVYFLKIQSGEQILVRRFVIE